MKQYYPSSNDFQNEIEIKHSRFITYIAHTPTSEDAQHFIAKIQQLHPKANHNCWAYIAGSRDNLRCWNCSDDGEPKGTAGKPMLNVLEHSELCEITVVVTRYFGGIKLGAGGLVRAYSQAVSQALKTLPTELRIELIPFTLTLPHHLVGDIERALASPDLHIDQREWTEQLVITGKGTSDALNSFHAALNNVHHLIDFKVDSDN